MVQYIHGFFVSKNSEALKGKGTMFRVARVWERTRGGEKERERERERERKSERERLTYLPHAD